MPSGDDYDPERSDRLRQLMEPVPRDAVSEEGLRLAALSREREATRERARRDALEEARVAVEIAREALGRDAVNPVALATLAAAVLGRPRGGK